MRNQHAPANSESLRSGETVPAVRSGAHRLHAWLILLMPLLAAASLAWLLQEPHLMTAAIAPLVLMYTLTAFGITAGYHRMLAHRTFQALPVAKAVLIALGAMAGQGPPIYWVANHRRHHRHSDRAGDPHSPHQSGNRELHGWRGFWHAYIGWTFGHELASSSHYCADLLRDPMVRAMNRRYLLWLSIGLIVPAVLGAVIAASWEGAVAGLLCGGPVRLALFYQVTNSINAAAHMWGTQSFRTGDRSCNNAWLAIPSLGEGWHNNHHAFQNSAVLDFEWWQIDLGGSLLRLLHSCRVVTMLSVPDRERIRERQQPKSSWAPALDNRDE